MPSSPPPVSFGTCNLLEHEELYSEPMRAETGRARPGAKEGREGRSVSLRPSLHFNQGLRYKILLSRAFQLWNLKHPHALSPNSFCIKKKVKKKKKNALKPTGRKEVFSFYIDIQNQHHTQKFLSRHFSRLLFFCVRVQSCRWDFIILLAASCVNNIYILYIFLIRSYEEQKEKKKHRSKCNTTSPLSLSPRVSFVAYAWCLLGPYPFTSSSSSCSTSPPFF